MTIETKQFVPSDVCLSCEGCCRFSDEKSQWRPKLARSEEHIALDELDQGYLKTRLCHGMYVCTFFNSEDSTCGVYNNRPFECKLYPFVLTKVNGKNAISVHLPCPYVEQKKDTEQYNQYVSYLEGFFKNPQIISLLDENPHLFGDYSGYDDQLEWVFDISC